MNELNDTITERRRLTRNSIYRYLFFSDAAHSKQEIATDLSLSLPTVHQNLTELFKAGLVRRCGTQQSTGGRRAMCITIAENAFFAVGISVTQTEIHFLAANLRMEEIVYKKIKQTFDCRDENIGKMLSDELENFLSENGLNRKKLLGIGVTLPAVIDAAREKIVFAPTMDLKDVSISRYTQYLKYPTYVSNDATSGGYAEWFTNSAENCMAYLFLENGVGGAAFLGGTPYEGLNGRSGEFGHMCIEPDGLKCRCGKRGCLEAYCSTSRISNDLGITLDTFFEELENKNAEYEKLWEDVLRHLAVGINNIHVALDCDVVIGGMLTQYMKPYMSELKRMATELNTFEDNADYIKLCRYPKRASTLGVALHFIEEFINSI